MKCNNCIHYSVCAHRRTLNNVNVGNDFKCPEYIFAPCNIGDTVYVIERDECDYPYDVTGYMFLASTINAVIVSAFLNGSDDAEEIIDDHMNETRSSEYTLLYVFPEKDCFADKTAAEQALREEQSHD